MNGRLMQRDVVAPGEVAPAAFDASTACTGSRPATARLVGRRRRRQRLRRHAGQRGHLGGVPEGELVEFVPVDDMLTTNICFGGDDLRTAYITASSTGRLLQADWPRAARGSAT